MKNESKATPSKKVVIKFPKEIFDPFKKDITLMNARVEVDVKLPKQWKDWCLRLGLQRHNTRRHPGCASPRVSKWDRNEYAWYYLKGKGFVWRINCYGEFQRGDKIEDFDRWALCRIDSYYPVPRTLQEFKDAVNNLIIMYSEDNE